MLLERLKIYEFLIQTSIEKKGFEFEHLKKKKKEIGNSKEHKCKKLTVLLGDD